MPIRISTLITFVLILASAMYWGVLLKQSYDRYTLWSHGQTANVLPIEDYTSTNTESNPKTTSAAKEYYVANLSAKLDSGEVIVIPQKPVTLEQITSSHRADMKIRFLPSNPRTNYFLGEEPNLLKTFAFACGASFAGIIWLRARRR